MIKLELPTDPSTVDRINNYFQHYYVKLRTELNTVDSYKNRLLDKILEVCGNMENFNLLVTGEWNEIKRVPSIYGYFLIGKYYLELIEMKAKDDSGKKTISQRDKWIRRLNLARSKFQIMDTLIDDLYTTTSDFYKFQKENKKKFKKFEKWNEIFGEILDYEDFRDRYRVNLCRDYNCQVCPYCNLNFLTNNNSFTKADIEHFYPKSIFSLFSVSKFNLNPGCKDCNRQFKTAKYFHYNPRYRTLDKGFKFSFTNNKNLIDDYLRLKKKPVANAIIIEPEFTQRDQMIEKVIRDLEIVSNYNNPDDIREIICEFIENNNKYYRESYQVFLGLWGSDEKVFKKCFGLDKDVYDNRQFMNKQLGKFKADIIDVLQKR